MERLLTTHEVAEILGCACACQQGKWRTANRTQDHVATPGPLYWDWRCLRCGEPVDTHPSLWRAALKRLHIGRSLTEWFPRKSHIMPRPTQPRPRPATPPPNLVKSRH